MLDIKNMSKEDKLFNFTSSLQPWAQVELQRQRVKDLPFTIYVTNGLVDSKQSKSLEFDSSKSKENKSRKRKEKKW